MPPSFTSIELVEYPATPIAIAQPSSVKVKSYDDRVSLAEDMRPFAPPLNAVSEPEQPGKATTAIVITTVDCVTGVSSLLHGLVTVALPVMAK
jgi:hypothetical protein